MREGSQLICDVCWHPIDASGPGVTNSPETDPWWQPFLEDLRSDPDEHRHARCFADAFGVDALIAVSIERMSGDAGDGRTVYRSCWRAARFLGRPE